MFSEIATSTGVTRVPSYLPMALRLPELPVEQVGLGEDGALGGGDSGEEFGRRHGHPSKDESLDRIPNAFRSHAPPPSGSGQGFGRYSCVFRARLLSFRTMDAALTPEPERRIVLRPGSSNPGLQSRAHTRSAGAFTADAMQAAAAKVETFLPQTKPGFSIFADLSQCHRHGTRLSVRPLTRIMDLCRAHRVGLIVRILPAKEHDIGINLLSLVHYRGTVKTVTVETTAEAERAFG